MYDTETDSMNGHVYRFMACALTVGWNVRFAQAQMVNGAGQSTSGTVAGIVRCTPDGGYRCAAGADDPLAPGEKAVPDNTPDSAAIARACSVCRRLRDTPKDLALLSVLAGECKAISDKEAFTHYLAIYRMGCLSAGKPDLAASAWRALVTKNKDGRYVKLLSDDHLKQPCPACAQSNTIRRKEVLCKTCDGVGLVDAPWKVDRVYCELLRDGEMNINVLTAELERTEQPPSAPDDKGEAVQTPVKKESAEPAQPPDEPLEVVTPARVKSDKTLWGKQITVTGRASQAGREIGTSSLVILEGILRCSLAPGQRPSARIAGHVIHVQGTVVPRPDLNITAKPHMVNCVILPFLPARGTPKQGAAISPGS